jgi:hypothetical protein
MSEITKYNAYALARRFADFVEMNLNGILAPSSFTESELEGLLMQTIKTTRPGQVAYYIRRPERSNCTPGVVYKMLLERLELILKRAPAHKRKRLDYTAIARKFVCVIKRSGDRGDASYFNRGRYTSSSFPCSPFWQTQYKKNSERIVSANVCFPLVSSN